MTSRPLKGGAAEKAAEDWLTSQGWKVHRARATAVKLPDGRWFVHSHDTWGAIDLAAMHPERGFLFVQVATVTGQPGALDFGNVAKRRKKVEALPWPKPSWERMGNGFESRTRNRSMLYQVQVWGARTIRRGSTQAQRFFQVWDLDIATMSWKLLPDKVWISGPQPAALPAAVAVSSLRP